MKKAFLLLVFGHAETSQSRDSTVDLSSIVIGKGVGYAPHYLCSGASCKTKAEEGARENAGRLCGSSVIRITDFKYQYGFNEITGQQFVQAEASFECSTGENASGPVNYYPNGTHFLSIRWRTS